jgi:hypothetical protein
MQSWRYFQVYGLLEFRLGNLSDPEIAIVRRYLGTLTMLEVAVPAASDNLDTDQASMWIRNKDELPTAYGFSTSGGDGSVGFSASNRGLPFPMARLRWWFD